MPVSAISSVRGMGLAVSVSTSTPSAMRLTASLCVTPKRCSSSTTRRPEVLELHVLGQQAVGADDHVDAPVGQSLHDLALLGR